MLLVDKPGALKHGWCLLEAEQREDRLTSNIAAEAVGTSHTVSRNVSLPGRFGTGARPMAASNLNARKIWIPVFANLDTTNISEDVRSYIVRHLVGQGDKRLVFVSAFSGNDWTPRVNGGATLGAHDNVQLYPIDRGKAGRRNLATERHLHFACRFTSEKRDRNIGDLKFRFVRTVVPPPR